MWTYELGISNLIVPRGTILRTQAPGCDPHVPTVPRGTSSRCTKFLAVFFVRILFHVEQLPSHETKHVVLALRRSLISAFDTSTWNIFAWKFGDRARFARVHGSLLLFSRTEKG